MLRRRALLAPLRPVAPLAPNGCDAARPRRVERVASVAPANQGRPPDAMSWPDVNARSFFSSLAMALVGARARIQCSTRVSMPIPNL